MQRNKYIILCNLNFLESLKRYGNLLSLGLFPSGGGGGGEEGGGGGAYFPTIPLRVVFNGFPVPLAEINLDVVC